MSGGDTKNEPSCLLSILWGYGSSVALGAKQAVSNTFIKAMKQGGDDWNVGVGTKKPLQERRFSYAHLAVSPREIIEAEKSEWKSGIAVLNGIPKGSEKATLQVKLEPGTKIFKSIQKHPLREEIMARLREAEKVTFIETAPYTLQIAFKTLIKKEVNVGPSQAMKQILSFEDNVPYAGGNIPLFCDDVQNITSNTVPVFKRELNGKVEEALERQKDLLECLEKDDEEGNNLLPYMENVFVMDWYSVIERHLFRVKCSGYGRRTGLELKELELFNMYKEKMEEKMRKLFFSDSSVRRKATKGAKWYENWLRYYRAELSAEETAEKKYKDIRVEIVHKKYDRLRRLERQRPPTEWLVKNRLLSC